MKPGTGLAGFYSSRLHRLADLRLPLLLILILGMGGCTHYRAGTGNTPPFQSVYVAPVEHRIPVAQTQALLTRQVTDRLARSGQTRLASEGGADATLQIVLVGLERVAVAAREEDTGRARKFSVTLRAECTLVQRSTGEIWMNRRVVEANMDVFTDSGLPQAEYESWPVLTDRLAEAIVRTVLAVW